MTTHNRCKELSEKDLRELFAQREEITLANQRHDARYGVAYEKFSWKSGYVKAAPNTERVALWEWHRQHDEARATQLGLKIV